MSLPRRGTRNRTRAKTEEKTKPKVRRGNVAEESMGRVKDLPSPYINKIKLEQPKQKALITFPMCDSDGTPLVKSVEHFVTKFGKKLSDDKWHSFQLPDDDDLYEECISYPDLDLVTTRFALIAIYDTDSKAIPTTARGIGYTFAWLKVSDFNKTIS